MSDRYYVHEATGFEVVPGVTRGSGRAVPDLLPTAFYVLDRAYCHRPVASFPNDASAWCKPGLKRYDEARESAIALVARLNASDAMEASA